MKTRNRIAGVLAAGALALGMLGGAAGPAMAGTPSPTPHPPHSKSLACWINFSACKVKSHCWYAKRAANAAIGKPVVFRKCDAWWG